MLAIDHMTYTSRSAGTVREDGLPVPQIIDLAAWVAREGMTDTDSVVQVVDLGAAAIGWHDTSAVADLAHRLRRRRADPAAPVMVGVSARALPPSAAPVLEQLAVTLAEGPGRWCAGSADDLPRILETTARSPDATRVLIELLEASPRRDVADGVLMESLAYSMLLAGPEFQAWREATPAAPLTEVDEPVRLARDGDRLEVTLNRPERHNAWGRQMRDGFLGGLELATLDETIAEVVVRGAGRSYCSGGDLDEFGTAPDVVSAHHVRLARSGALAVTALRERLGAGLRFELHGHCIGAGVEVPAAAAHLVADPQTRFRLPELRFGLVPGAGGTVTLPRRIGRWRTAWMALTDSYVDATTALDWGLIDEIG